MGRKFAVGFVIGLFVLGGCASYEPESAQKSSTDKTVAQKKAEASSKEEEQQARPEQTPTSTAQTESAKKKQTMDKKSGKTKGKGPDKKSSETEQSAEKQAEARVASQPAKEKSAKLEKEAEEIDNVDARRSDRSVILKLREKILFDLRSAKVKSTAWPTLDEVAKLLLAYPKYWVVVQGHTDNLPVQTKKFPSNWDLSAKRAVNVVKYLSNLEGLDESRLIAAGMGPHHPVASNETPEKRRLNRRVEIILYPKDLPQRNVPVPRP
ncbi:MAG: OmpA family protein [bacterium]